MARRKAPAIPDDLLDQLLAGGDAATALKKALAERALSAEMDYHLGNSAEAENSRNGYGWKSVSMCTGKIEIAVPRDRASSFDPQLIAKYQRRFPGFDHKIISMYARGMSTREIAEHLREVYCMDASAKLISTITDAVLDEVTTCQQRPLDPVYPLAFFEALESIRQGVRRHFGAFGKDVVRGLSVRHDHGSQYMADVFQQELTFLGIKSSPAFVRAPEGNGCAERFIRTLKENLLWVQSFATIENLQAALAAFREIYNTTWLIERHGFQPPAAVRDSQLAAAPLAA